MTTASVASAPITQVLFFDGVDDLDAVGPLEILVAAGFPARPVRPGAHHTTVHTAHGLTLEISDSLDDSAQLVIVPGGGWVDMGPGVRVQSAGPLPARLAEMSQHGTVIASVCTGAMLLATAGLLSGQRAVTNRLALDDLAGCGAIVERNARVVDVGEVVTCGGPSAGLDLGIHLVTRFLGVDAGRAAAARLKYEPR